MKPATVLLSMCAALSFLSGCGSRQLEEPSKAVELANDIRNCVNTDLRNQSIDNINLKFFSLLTNQTQYYFTFQVHGGDAGSDPELYRAGITTEAVVKEIQNNNYSYRKGLVPKYPSASKSDDAVIGRVLSGDRIAYDNEAGLGYSNRVALHGQRSVVVTLGAYIVEFLQFDRRGDDQLKRIEDAKQAIELLDRSIQKCLK